MAADDGDFDGDFDDGGGDFVVVFFVLLLLLPGELIFWSQRAFFSDFAFATSRFMRFRLSREHGLVEIGQGQAKSPNRGRAEVNGRRTGWAEMTTR